MRLVLAMVLAGMVALPLSASAQAGEEGADVKSTRPAFAFIPEHLKQRLPQHRHKPAPSSEPAPEEPALELKLDEAGVEVIARTPEEADASRRVDRARYGFYFGGLSAGGGLIGGGAIVLGLSYMCIIGECEQPASPGAFNAGLIMMAIGAAAMITSGTVYGVRKRQLRELQQAHYERPRRVQWDLARSRLVF